MAETTTRFGTADRRSTGPAESTTRLPYPAYLDHLRSDGERLAALAAGALDAPVPSCPGWTVADVVGHTAAVYHHKTTGMRIGRRPREGEWSQGPAEGADLLAWYGAALTELLAELQSRGPDAATPTWFPPEQHVGFWFRRMAHEAAVHRVDVESAVGALTAVADELAVDGIDEVLGVFLASFWEEDLSAKEVIVAVRTGEHVWRIALGAGPENALRRGPGSADATVTGEPSELLLWLWGRRPSEAVNVSGEASAIEALRRQLVQVTQ